MAENEKDETGLVTKASVAYIEKTKLRASIQAIPYVGGSLDTLLSGQGTKYQSERLENFIKDLNKRLQRLEGLNTVEPTENLFDLMMQVFNEVVKTRSEEKRKCFANIVANQVVNECAWDEAETATRLLSDLTDLHIKILQETLKAPKNIDGVFKDKRVIILSDVNTEDPNIAVAKPSTNISPKFPDVPVAVLKMACSELFARGLLHDEGIGRFDASSMQYFIATEMAQWLMDWIAEPKDLA